MSAIAARRESEQVRLWTGSALAALLMHLVPAVLLVLFIPWSSKLPPLAGFPAALDIELASVSPATVSRQSRISRMQFVAVNPVNPLRQMQSVPQPGAVSSNAAPVADAEGTDAPIESSDLGTSGASDPEFQLWEDEIVARLASYKEYPSSALQQMQQDTVTLQFSVDQSGRVTYSRVDSTHHYQALEQEVQQMLRLAGRLPAPPPQLSAESVVTVPVQFSLDLMSNMLCGVSGCPDGHNAHPKPKAVAPPAPTLASCTDAASPGPAPAGAAATLEQMRAYRERLNQYLATAGSQLACLSQVRETDTLALRDTLTGQLKSLVNGFNAEARAFEARAQAQVQQTRQRQAQALAVQAYATCKLPTALPAPGLALTAEGAQSYRRQLVGYQSAVRSYVACLRQADLVAAAPDRGLANDQRAQLAQTAIQLGDAAIQLFNQAAGTFNSQVPHLQQQALAQAQWNLAQAGAPPLAPSCVVVDRYHSPLLFGSHNSDVIALQQSESTEGQWRFTNNCGMWISLSIVAPTDPHSGGNKGQYTAPVNLAPRQAFLAPYRIRTYKYFVCPRPWVAFDGTSSPGHVVNVRYETSTNVCLFPRRPGTKSERNRALRSGAIAGQSNLSRY